MLISPPFLIPLSTAPLAPESDDTWLARCMQTDGDRGQYPLGFALGWHGGLHLIAPAKQGGQAGEREPVVAVADGTVLYAKPSAEKTDDAGHPLNYGGGWTHNGVVVLQHTTEIGEGDGARLTYLSVYMHLSAVGAAITPGARVLRKQAIGQAGEIDGQPHRIHFEILFDDLNLRNLVGRRAGAPSLQEHGRSDTVYGDVYFHIPADVPVFVGAADQPPPVDRLAPTNGTSVSSWADSPRILHTRWQAGRRIDRVLVSRGENAADSTGWFTASSSERTQDRAEYELFEAANQWHRRLPARLRLAPALLYELLRFGRLLDAEQRSTHADLLAQLPRWHFVALGSGLQDAGWVNLGDSRVTAYTDADFPPWQNWTLVDDSADGNNRCDSPTLLNWLAHPSDEQRALPPSLAELSMRSRHSSVMVNLPAQLSKTLCKFPTEWDARHLDAAWSWLKESQPTREVLSAPLSEADYTRFKAHAEALCFWQDLPPALASQRLWWHAHPVEFMRVMRRCGWLSYPEFVQLVPSHALRNVTGPAERRRGLWEQVRTNTNAERNRIFGTQRVELNKMFRRYGINMPWRQISFFGNAVQETMWFSDLQEFLWRSTWYTPWHGRGFLQLTNPENYCDYWLWRGRTVSDALRSALANAYSAIYAKPPSQRSSATLTDNHFPLLSDQIKRWRRDVHGGDEGDGTTADNLLAPADSAGFYWLKNNMARYADEPHVVSRVAVETAQGTRVYYQSPAFWRASAAVNLPSAINRLYSPSLNGFDSRGCAYGVAIALLAEAKLPDADGAATLAFPEGYDRRQI